MRRTLIVCVACLSAFIIAAGADALKVADPTPSQSFSDTTGNQGYVEVAAEDGAVLRGCNENEATPAGDDFTGYVWVNPGGESTPATYGNETIGAGDADGEDGAAPRDIDEDTNDDCTGNDNDPDPTP